MIAENRRPPVALASSLSCVKAQLPVAGGCGMREVLMIYLSGVILLLAVSTMINDEEEIGLDHILIAGFGWPILTPLLALRAWHGR
jgi:hypothetical protein